MSAQVSDLITDTRNAARPNSARVSSGRSAGGATLACDNLTGWPIASKVHFVTYQIDSSSNPVAGTQLDCYGIRSGNNITSLTVVDGTDAGNLVNDVVEMLPTAAWGQDLATALTTAHDRTGVHKSGATYASPNFSGTATGTYTLAGTPTVASPTITGTPTFPAGSIPTAAIADAAVTPVKMLGVDIFATGASYTGSAPAAGTGQFYVQVGSDVITTTGSGQYTRTLPTTFPTGLLTVIAFNGDTAAGSAQVTGVFNASLSAFSVQFALASAVTYRLNWIAYGW